jgi:hypothetical protein
LQVAIESIGWRGLRCVVKTTGASPDLHADIRMRSGDPATSLVAASKPIGADGAVSLLVQDEDRESQAVFVVLVDAHGMVLAQHATVVGG